MIRGYIDTGKQTLQMPAELFEEINKIAKENRQLKEQMKFILTNLFNIIDQLGYELEYERGNLSKKQFKKLVLNKLEEDKEVSEEELLDFIKVIEGMELDADEISIMFKIPISQGIEIVDRMRRE